jgi:hypothetical protein
MKNAWTIFAFLLFSATPGKVGAVDPVTVAVATDRLEGTLNGVIDNAGATANIAVFNAATEARLLISQ